MTTVPSSLIGPDNIAPKPNSKCMHNTLSYTLFFITFMGRISFYNKLWLCYCLVMMPTFASISIYCLFVMGLFFFFPTGSNVQQILLFNVSFWIILMKSSNALMRKRLIIIKKQRKRVYKKKKIYKIKIVFKKWKLKKYSEN